MYTALCGVRLNGGMIRDISKEPKNLNHLHHALDGAVHRTRATQKTPARLPETACNYAFERKGQSYFLCYAKKENKFVPMEGAGCPHGLLASGTQSDRRQGTDL